MPAPTLTISGQPNWNPPEVLTQPDGGEIAPAEFRNHLVSSVEDVSYLDRVVPT